MTDGKIWYVYMHTNQINNKKYVGITGMKPEYRWQEGRGYKTQLFGRAIEKYGWDNFKHEILETVSSRDKACELEKYYIKKYNSNNNNFGYNVSSGGDSSNEGIYNLPSMSIPVYQYNLDGKFLAEFPSMMEAERKTGIDNSAICACCRGLHSYTKNFIWSYKKHDKINGIDKKQLRYDLITQKQEKKVYQYNLSGIFIREYKSLSEAGKISGVNFKCISDCCLNENIKQAGNYIWSYEYHDSVEPYVRLCDKNIYKYDINSCLVKIYDNIDDAMNDSNLTRQTIQKACNESKRNTYCLHCGYIWSYDSINYIKLKEIIKNIKQNLEIARENRSGEIKSSKYSNTEIYQYSKQGIFIRKYNNIHEVIEVNNLKKEARNSILACCQGKSKTSYEYQWSFTYVSKMNEVNKLQTDIAILKLDRNGMLIKEYPDMASIHKDYSSMNADRLTSNILNCAHGRMKTFDNYIWIFKDEYKNLNIKERQKSYAKKPVEQYDINNKYLRTFASIVEANKYLGVEQSHIGSCCSGKRKTDHGFIWKYAS